MISGILNFIRGKLFWLGWGALALGIFVVVAENLPRGETPTLETLKTVKGTFAGVVQTKHSIKSAKVKTYKYLVETGGQSLELRPLKGFDKPQGIINLVGQPAVAQVYKDDELWTLSVGGQPIVTYAQSLSHHTREPRYELALMLILGGLLVLFLRYFVFRRR